MDILRTGKLLDFAPSGKRIAYAASAAWGKQPPEWLALAQREFPKFSAISVRENTGWKYAGKPAQKS